MKFNVFIVSIPSIFKKLLAILKKNDTIILYSIIFLGNKKITFFIKWKIMVLYDTSILKRICFTNKFKGMRLVIYSMKTYVLESNLELLIVTTLS